MSTRRVSPSRRTFLRTAAAASLLVATGARGQTAWPDRTVKIIIPYPAGGSTDVLSRILAERLNQIYGQPFVIENRPGAGGNIGIAAVTGSAPDGYTIGAATIGHFAINQFLYKNMPYDPERDMIPASLTWELPNVFVVASDHVPAKTVGEFVAWAKRKGHVSFGSPGVGTSPHLSGVLFAKRSGLAPCTCRSAARRKPFRRCCRARSISPSTISPPISRSSSPARCARAVTSATRWPTLPDVPTMGEAGVRISSSPPGPHCAAGGDAAADRREAVRRDEADRRRRGDGSGFCRPPASCPARRRRPSPSPARSGRCGRMWWRCRG